MYTKQVKLDNTKRKETERGDLIEYYKITTGFIRMDRIS